MIPFNKIVVVGGGVIGNSIAYYLAKRNIAVSIVDPVGLSPAASGKAGGFLARDWNDGTPLQQLQQRSFDLHSTLAQDLGATNIGYRRLSCVAVSVNGKGVVQKPVGKKLDSLEWADVDVIGMRPMGDENTIAQVHPRKLCKAMFEYSEKAVGTKLVIGRVIDVVLADDSSMQMRGVVLDEGDTLDADALIVACGPWTGEANTWFANKPKLPPMYGTKYHSILIKSPRVLSQAVFFQGAGDPEVYPRPDGDAYITGFPDPSVVVNESPGQETVDEVAIQRLKDATRTVSSELGNKEPHTAQCCYLPSTSDGVPIIGPIPSVNGAFVAAGHSCWGILNGPATGEAMAELVTDGKTTHVNLDAFSLKRFASSQIVGR